MLKAPAAEIRQNACGVVNERDRDRDRETNVCINQNKNSKIKNRNKIINIIMAWNHAAASSLNIKTNKTTDFPIL